MSFMDIFNTVFEFALFALLIWGIFNEHRLVAFERRIAAYFRRRKFKVIKTDRKAWN